MKKTLGRLAGAVLASALIGLAVAPVASAQEADTTAPTSEVATPPTSDTPATDVPTSDAPTSDAPTSDAPSTSDTPTTGAQPTDSTQPGEPSNTGEPTSQPTEPTSTTTSGSEETTTPEEPPYEDDIAFGIDLDGNQGIFVIACAAGEPTNVHSNDFDLVEGPIQDETDGRYWEWLVTRHDGVSFDAGNVTADWTCSGKPADDHPVPPAGGASSGSAGTTGGDGTSQVKYAPKGGVETGFGGMAA
ncbi:hypothetical protein [Amycolatopsis sp. NPDC051903]|uniref:hypothetical protein n=1 Tax=Amycolatopsis sp. NPDC051903 TaxID=3363936 RepID=UPI003798945C